MEIIKKDKYGKTKVQNLHDEIRNYRSELLKLKWQILEELDDTRRERKLSDKNIKLDLVIDTIRKIN